MNKGSKHKKESIGSMFDSIAHGYDFLNHFLSLGIDRYWRREAINLISLTHTKCEILDVATGTGDLAIAAMKLDPVHITGIDISLKMLERGEEKINKKGLSEKIDLLFGYSEKLPFEDDSFDVVMVAFGVRNFSDPVKGLSEMDRVLRRGGLIMVLEFSKPDKFPLKQFYGFYFLRILPLIGRIFSGNRNAYNYLPESVLKFPDREQFLELLNKTGFSDLKCKRLTGGIASVYTGLKI
jgi:demethylmenaquinone methyltransferase/2-methoxy-6-polyprenyl-1,4-benzoquinol methylase